MSSRYLVNQGAQAGMAPRPRAGVCAVCRRSDDRDRIGETGDGLPDVVSRKDGVWCLGIGYALGLLTVLILQALLGQ